MGVFITKNHQFPINFHNCWTVVINLSFSHLFPDTSILSSPDYDTIKIEKRILKKTLPISSISGDVPSGAGQIGSRIDKTLGIIRSKIDEAVESVESDIAVSNRDKVILALANFLGSKWYWTKKQIKGIYTVPRTTVSFQKLAARSKIDRFPKIFH